jgi:hypothetical protein
LIRTGWVVSSIRWPYTKSYRAFMDAETKNRLIELIREIEDCSTDTGYYQEEDEKYIIASDKINRAWAEIRSILRSQ